MAVREVTGQKGLGICHQNRIFDHLFEFTHIPGIGLACEEIQGLRAENVDPFIVRYPYDYKEFLFLTRYQDTPDKCFLP